MSHDVRLITGCSSPVFSSLTSGQLTTHSPLILEGLFWGWKCASKPNFGADFLELSQDFKSLVWSDPNPGFRPMLQATSGKRSGTRARRSGDSKMVQLFLKPRLPARMRSSSGSWAGVQKPWFWNLTPWEMKLWQRRRQSRKSTAKRIKNWIGPCEHEGDKFRWHLSRDRLQFDWWLKHLPTSIPGRFT